MMSIFSKGANNGWQKFKDLFNVGQFLSYDSFDTYILVIFTMVLTMEREYGMKTARLGMEWFGIDNRQSIETYKGILDVDPYLVNGDRVNIINMIMATNYDDEDIDNFESYLSSSQWFASMIFVNKRFFNHKYQKVDNSALFPTNITKVRVKSYLGNETKLPIFQQAVDFVDGIPFIGSRAMKLHLIGLTTSLMWYSNDPAWNSEHKKSWVRGDDTKNWLERRARLNLERGLPFNSGRIF